MKLKATIESGTFSHDGVIHKIENWIVDVPEHVAQVLTASHGFMTIAEDDDDPNAAPTKELTPAETQSELINRMSRNELFASLKSMGVPVTLPIKNNELRDMLRSAIASAAEKNAGPVSPPPPPPPPPPPLPAEPQPAAQADASGAQTEAPPEKAANETQADPAAATAE